MQLSPCAESEWRPAQEILNRGGRDSRVVHTPIIRLAHPLERACSVGGFRGRSSRKLQGVRCQQGDQVIRRLHVACNVSTEPLRESPGGFNAIHPFPGSPIVLPPMPAWPSPPPLSPS